MTDCGRLWLLLLFLKEKKFMIKQLYSDDMKPGRRLNASIKLPT